MCYAIPGRVVSIEGKRATLDYFGEKREANMLFQPGNRPLEAGDYVYAQGGIIVDRLDREEAQETLKIWEERFFELKRKDEGLELGNAEGELSGVLDKAAAGGILTYDDMKKVLEAEGHELEALYKSANKVRSKSISNSCCVHGIIEFSNHCVNACAYCGLNTSNKGLRRYRMDADEIVERVGYAVSELGFKALVLQSGEDPYYTDDMLVDIVRRIRERYGILLFMSIGERSFDCYRRLNEAGAYGALLRFETSNKKIYSLMRPGKMLEDRLDLIRKLIGHGFIVATGFLLGLPGTTKEDLMKDILLTKSLAPDMYSFGPLIPHPCTQLSDTPKVGLDEALKAIALSRLMDHEAKILVTTALETLHPEGKRRGLLAGGNSLMINVTPERYKGQYEIYPGKAGNDAAIKDTIDETLELLYSLGRAPTDLGV